MHKTFTILRKHGDCCIQQSKLLIYAFIKFSCKIARNFLLLFMCALFQANNFVGHILKKLGKCLTATVLVEGASINQIGH